MLNGILLLAALTAVSADPQTTTITVDAAKVVNRVSPLMYGSCIEDVNHEIYGGLYAQMIFGESFEEPPQLKLPEWKNFGGAWSVQDGVCSVKSDAGAKLLWTDGPTLLDGVVECDLKFDDHPGDSAGLILRVQQPGVGADAFVGYEISIGPWGKFLRLGRHRHDWKLLQQTPIVLADGPWHHLRVEMTGPKLSVYVDGAAAPTIVYTDNDAPLAAGKIGLRTWNAGVQFRNLVVDEGTKKRAKPQFVIDRGDGVSGMWDAVAEGDAQAKFTWDADRPFNSARSQKIELTGGRGTAGVANRGLNRWGLAIRENHAYAGRVYLRQAGYSGSVTVALQSADGKKTYAHKSLGPIDKDWRKFEFVMPTTETDTTARLSVSIDKPGAVWIDQVYLCGTGDDLFHELPIRGDIGRELQAQGLTVLRYGGCMVNAPEYRWKKMIGDRDRRPEYPGWWYPHTTNGFGIEEFLQFCDAAKFEKVFAINVEETPQDAADLVDYFNGPVSTEWGKRRADNGHPEPYRVNYIEIGNEEATAPHYIERFKLLHEAMHARDPKLQFIVAAWWEPENPATRRIVEQLDGKADLWDVHVGGDDLHEGRSVDALFTRMEKLVRDWAPATKLKACVLEENGGRHDLQRALGHARVLNATQRHGDFVLMDCPANCLQALGQNDNDWNQGQVFYNSGQVWGMAPFYAQQMAAGGHLPCRVASDVSGDDTNVDVTATRSENGDTLVLKLVNVADKPRRCDIRLEHFGPLEPTAKVQTLRGALSDVNTPEQPERIRSVESTLDHAADRFEYEAPPYSYTVLRMKKRS